MFKKKLLVSLVITAMLCVIPTSFVFASDVNEPVITQEELKNATVADTLDEDFQNAPMPRKK